MKALVLDKYKELSVKEVEKPAITSREVLIRVKACAICGSDVHGIDGSSGRRQPPIVMGHEASGIIEELGKDVKGFSVGDKVVFNSTLFCGECYFCKRGAQNMCANGKVFGVSCDNYRLQGAMAEYVSVPYHILYKMPEGVGFEQAALVEPLSIALHAVNYTNICINDVAIVFGTGTIGLMVLKLLKKSNCGKVFMVDVDDFKLEMARANYADLCINPLRENVVEIVMRETQQMGADIAFEAVGISATTNTGIECLKKGGSFTLLGNISPKIEIMIQRVVLNEIRMIGAYCCANEYETSLNLMANKRIVVDDLISIVAPLEEANELFKRLYNAEKGLVKIVLMP